MNFKIKTGSKKQYLVLFADC